MRRWFFKEMILKGIMNRKRTEGRIDKIASSNRTVKSNSRTQESTWGPNALSAKAADWHVLFIAASQLRIFSFANDFLKGRRTNWNTISLLVYIT